MNIFDRNECLAFAVHQGMYRKIIKMSEKKQPEKNTSVHIRVVYITSSTETFHNTKFRD